LGWVWGKWEQNVIDFQRDWYILSYAYKVMGETKVHTRCLADYPSYDSTNEASRENDKELVLDLWHVLDKADIIIAHNGDRFDLPKINTRCVHHKMAPPTPYLTVDTLKIARRVFKFDSNKLDDLARYLHVGRKLPHTGFHLWQGCMLGDLKSFKLMKEYNAHDIELLEEIYLKMRPWAKVHPNVNKGEFACPKCGSRRYQHRGYSYTAFTMRPRYQCNSCRGWYTGRAEKRMVA
jgi:DNA polymerase elongation subunit (family B)